MHLLALFSDTKKSKANIMRLISIIFSGFGYILRFGAFVVAKTDNKSTYAILYYTRGRQTKSSGL